jgi:hypothetical protein
MAFVNSEIERFTSEGFVVLRSGFSRSLAPGCRDFIWKQVRLWDQCTTYGQPMVQIQKVYNCSPFDKIMNDRLRSALDGLVGPGNWREPPGYGWWSLLFPGSAGPGGWHVDGGQFRVSGRLTDHGHALVTLFLFSDAGPGDGGTVMIPGSHLTVARTIANAGDSGISWSDVAQRLPASLLNPEESRIAHLVGEAGDIVLMHPFLIHGFGQNRGRQIRFACNPLIQSTRPMDSTRPPADRSPVETAIRLALDPNSHPERS